MNIFHISFYLKLSSQVCFTSLLCLKYIRWLTICFYVLQHNPPIVPCFRLAWICTVSISGTVFNQLSCIRQLHSVWPLSATVVWGRAPSFPEGHTSCRHRSKWSFLLSSPCFWHWAIFFIFAHCVGGAALASEPQCSVKEPHAKGRDVK